MTDHASALDTPQSAPVMVRLADVQPVPVRWLWPNRFALGKLTLIAGDPGLGKSFTTLDMAARVSTGAGWPDAPGHAGEQFEPGGVVLMSAEDDVADTIRPRLDAAGADCTRIMALQGVTYRDEQTGATVTAGVTLDDVAPLEAAIKATPGCRLVIIDPVSAYMGKADSHVNAEVRATLAKLADLAQRYDVAMVAVTHLRKGEGAAIYRAMGSLAFVAAARAAWAVSKDGDDPTGRRRLWLPVKNNIATDVTGLAFQIDGDPPSVRWEAEPVTISADDALAGPARRNGPDPEERDAAETWLRDALADGPRPARELYEESREAEGITKRTLERAKKALAVEAYRDDVPGPWYWRLPNTAKSTPPRSPIHEEPGGLGGLAISTGETGIGDPATSNIAKLRECGGVGPTDPEIDAELEAEMLYAEQRANEVRWAMEAGQ